MNDFSFDTLADKAVDTLASAERLVAVIGEGVEDSAALRCVVDRLKPALFLTPSADRGYAFDVLSRYSFGRKDGVEAIVERADRALFINAPCAEFVGRGGLDFRTQEIVHLFDHSRLFLRGMRPTLSIKSPIERSLGAIAARIERRGVMIERPWYEHLLPTPPEPPSEPTTGDSIHPSIAARIIQDEAPANVIFAVDIGAFTAHVLRAVKLTPGQRWICPIEREACMGEALLMAPGLAAHHPERPILVVVGDGGFAMAPNELRSFVEEGANITVLVWQNNGFQAVDEGLRYAYGETHALPSGLWRSDPPDFVGIARGWGALASEARSADALRRQLRRAFASKSVSVIVAMIDPSVPSPMTDRFAHFKRGGAAIVDSTTGGASGRGDEFIAERRP